MFITFSLVLQYLTQQKENLAGKSSCHTFEVGIVISIRNIQNKLENQALKSKS